PAAHFLPSSSESEPATAAQDTRTSTLTSPTVTTAWRSPASNLSSTISTSTTSCSSPPPPSPPLPSHPPPAITLPPTAAPFLPPQEELNQLPITERTKLYPFNYVSSKSGQIIELSSGLHWELLDAKTQEYILLDPEQSKVNDVVRDEFVESKDKQWNLWEKREASKRRENERTEHLQAELNRLLGRGFAKKSSTRLRGPTE
ncbi:hypothetical protein CYMTET_23042, partial [Cymbomonas tetramitiformis]